MGGRGLPSSSSSDDSREIRRSVEVVARGDFFDGVELLRREWEGGRGGSREEELETNEGKG